MHLNRGDDSTKTHNLLQILSFTDQIAVKGIPTPIQAGNRWPGEHTHSQTNSYGKLHRCTDKRKTIIEFYLCLTTSPTVIHRLTHRTRTVYRWPTRPTTRRLR